MKLATFASTYDLPLLYLAVMFVYTPANIKNVWVDAAYNQTFNTYLWPDGTEVSTTLDGCFTSLGRDIYIVNFLCTNALNGSQKDIYALCFIE